MPNKKSSFGLKLICTLAIFSVVFIPFSMYLEYHNISIGDYITNFLITKEGQGFMGTGLLLFGVVIFVAAYIEDQKNLDINPGFIALPMYLGVFFAGLGALLIAASK